MGGKHQCVVASNTPPTGELACNPGMCPDGELNQRPFDLQAGTQSTEPQQLGPELNFKTTVTSTVRGPQFLHRKSLRNGSLVVRRPRWTMSEHSKGWVALVTV